MTNGNRVRYSTFIQKTAIIPCQDLNLVTLEWQDNVMVLRHHTSSKCMEEEKSTKGFLLNFHQKYDLPRFEDSRRIYTYKKPCKRIWTLKTKALTIL